MKHTLLAILLLALVGCDKRPLDQHDYTKTTLSNIPELADCVYIKIEDVRIIRCPNSDTTVTSEVQQGKTRKTLVTTVINGEQK
jgi:hypothetical protein